jgi:hypothetical protein
MTTKPKPRRHDAPDQREAVIWARFSPRPDAKDSESNKNQIDRCRIFCAQQGLAVTDALIFQRADVSGKDAPDESNPEKYLDKIPELRAAILATSRGRMLVVRWRNRIARSVFVQEYVRRLIWKRGGDILAADEPNGVDPHDVFSQQLFASLSEMDRMVRNAATSSGMLRNQYDRFRRMGRADRCPFGYAPDPKDGTRLIELPDEQLTLQLMRDAAAKGMGAREICRYLDKQNRDRRGKRWEGAAGIVMTILKRLRERA